MKFAKTFNRSNFYKEVAYELVINSNDSSKGSKTTTNARANQLCVYSCPHAADLHVVLHVVLEPSEQSFKSMTNLYATFL